MNERFPIHHLGVSHQCDSLTLYCPHMQPTDLRTIISPLMLRIDQLIVINIIAIDHLSMETK